MALKQSKNNASILVLATFVLTALSLVVFTAWQASSLLNDVVQQRRIFYKRFYSTELLLNAGVVLVKNNFDSFLSKQAEEQMPINIDLSSILNKSFKACVGVVSIKRPVVQDLADTLEIQASLIQNTKAVCCLRCWVKKTKININGNQRRALEVQQFSVNVN